MTRPLYWLGRSSARHHWVVIGAWIVVAVMAVLLARSAGDRTADNLTMPGTDSTRATDVLEAKLPQNAFGARSLTWWGTAAFVAIEGTGFALGIASYLYLAQINPQWPIDAPPPDLAPGTIIKWRCGVASRMCLRL